MPYITREDGERFVIPSYRDTLSAKKISLLKREVLLLSQNYGEYITLQRKDNIRYEIAFSPDLGYLLGETIWHYFKRPSDLVYCEAIPNSTDAILVIVKSGSVHLDGRFPIDSIPEELLIFRTQQNNFDINIYGDVPIVKTPEPGKFAFDSASIKSFTVLDSPIFPTLPTVKAFQLKPVDTVLKSQGIGVFPAKKALTVIVTLGIMWMAWVYVSTHKKELPQVIVGVVNPYQTYLDTLSSPDPFQEIARVVESIRLLYTIPGWSPQQLTYEKGIFRSAVKSKGARTDILFKWANRNKAMIEVLPEGFYVQWPIFNAKRLPPDTISKLKDIIGNLIDRLSYVLTGDHMEVGQFVDRRIYQQSIIKISFTNATPSTIELIGQQLKGLPLILDKVTIVVDNGSLTGSINLEALGN